MEFLKSKFRKNKAPGASTESEGPKAEPSWELSSFSALKQGYKATMDMPWLRRRGRRQPDEEIQMSGESGYSLDEL